MAGESPVSIAVRRLARARPDIHAALFGTDARLPMVFQYNPLIHHLEVNAGGEVVCTVSRLDLLAPRIRYNVHDSGGIVDFATVRRVLGSSATTSTGSGRQPRSAVRAARCRGRRPIPLPFLWIHGRRDATISVMGANIYPEDFEAVLYGDPQIGPRMHSFMISVVDDEHGTPRPAVAMELTDLDGIDEAWRTGAAERLRDGLRALNIDYRTSLDEFPGAMLPIVSTHGLGTGPFAGDATRIKQRRIG